MNASLQHYVTDTKHVNFYLRTATTACSRKIISIEENRGANISKTV